MNLKIPSKLHFMPAGIPLETPNRNVLTGAEYLKKINLDGMELEFVQQVWLKKEMAQKLKEISKDLLLTAHGSYYINLNSPEKEKVGASRSRIIQASRMAWLAGAYSVTFHPAYYLKQDPSLVYKNVKVQLQRIVQELKDEGNKIWIRPETTGKPTQFANLHETIKLSQEIDQVLPCIDFSHLHARSNGKFNTSKEFKYVLELLEKELGKESLKNMHIHLSGINYGEKGERNHLNLDESDMNYKELLSQLKDFNCKGALVCESPDIVGDAQILKQYYHSI